MLIDLTKASPPGDGNSKLESFHNRLLKGNLTKASPPGDGNDIPYDSIICQLSEFDQSIPARGRKLHIDAHDGVFADEI